MSFSGELEEETVEVLFTQPEEDESEELPIDEWSSLQIVVVEENPKKLLFEEGLWEAGSGEICTKYIAQSGSTVFRHPYYDYPGIEDPGIEQALLEPEDEIKYSDDGQELYLAICKAMGQCPVRIFHRNLKEDTIDLKYYGVNPNGIRAMAMALMNNRIVSHLDLTDNFMNDDACLHLGEMLMYNHTLSELNMSGCHIKPNGCARLLAGLIINRTLKKLILNRNELEDESAEHIAKAIKNGTELIYLSLSYNNLGAETANLLAEAFEYKNKIKGLDLSCNNLYGEVSLSKFLQVLADSGHLTQLDLSWNGLQGSKIGSAIGNIFDLCHHLKIMNLSNNKLTTESLKPMLKMLVKAKKLQTFNLSNNPLTPADAQNIVDKFNLRGVKCKNMLLDNIMVTEEFLNLRRNVLAMKDRESTVITYGDVIPSVTPKEIDIRVLLLKRADFIAKKPKKNKVDIAVWAMEKYYRENVDMMTAREMTMSLHQVGVKLDDDLTNGLCDAFLGIKTQKEKFISLKLLVDYAHRMWPEREMPPPPPPPPPPPEPEPSPKTKDKKKDKKKK